MNVIFFILIAMIIGGCSNVEEGSRPALPPYKPEFKVFKQGDRQYIYLWLASADTSNKGKRQFMKSIKKAEVNLLFGKRLLNNLTFNDFLVTEKTSDTSDIMVFAGITDFQFSNPKLRTNNVTVQIKLYTDSSIYAIEKYYSKVYDSMHVENNGTLDLIPMEIKTSGNEYIFGLLAIRKKKVEEEYIPDSEALRIQIQNHRGKEVWSSNFGMNYMQMIQPVKPEEVGSSYLYLQMWDGKSNKGREMFSDEYNIKYLIPAKPKPYFIMKQFSAELEW